MEVQLDLDSLPAEIETPTCACAITASLGATPALLSHLHQFLVSKQNDDVKHLKEDMEEITASLMKLAEAENPSSTTMYWMEEARDLSYDIHDYFDSIISSGADAEDTKISEFKARSKDALERRDRYRIIDLLTFCRRLPALPAEMIYHGRMDEFARKLDIDNEKKRKVVPIFGPEGVGKTTLAKRIYRKIGRNFQCRAFVRASPDPNFRSLLTSVFIQIQQQQPIQIQREQASCSWDEHDLIEKINEHLQNKRYFIIIDDLWDKTWDTISRAFPSGDCCSRIITTTQIEDVALACCSNQSEDVFKMIPLNVVLQSRNLFFRGVFGFEGDCSQVFLEVLHGIIRNCGDFPSATINIKGLFEQWKEVMKEVVYLMYNNLPLHLKTCLLYLNMYPEGYIIRKDELVKQWLAEGFLCKLNMKDREEIAGGYFDVLVSRGMLQPVEKKYNKVFSCTVHRMVWEIIACKSKEQNFITTVDYCQSNATPVEKVHRLSVQFGGSRSADIAECIGVAEVRSLAFFGFFECIPSVEEFSLLRLLVLHIWADEDEESVDLTGIGQLCQLRYLKIICNILVQLPTQIERLKCLETLEVEASEAILPHGIQDITSLSTLGYFDLSSNSTERVMDLQKLVNLQHLHLTCSKAQCDDLKDKIKCLCTILEELSNLESLTFVPRGSSHVNPDGTAGASSTGISCDVLSSVSPASAHLQRLELSRRYCIFSRLPEWTKDLSKLSILKIAVGVLSPQDIIVLGGLPALTALSLYVQTTLAEKIIIDQKGFPILTYFKFICDAPHLSFREGAMPNVQKLVLGINPNRMWQYDPTHIGIQNLSGLKEISAKIGGADESERRAAESALEATLIKHPSRPIVDVQWVDWIFLDVILQQDLNKSRTSMVSEISSPMQITDSNKEIKDVASHKKEITEATSSAPVSAFKDRYDSYPELTLAMVPTRTPSPIVRYVPNDTPNRPRAEWNWDLMVEVGLVKCVLEGALTKAKSAIVMEAKLQQRGQRDLTFIIGEFQNMKSLLDMVDEERVKDILVKTWVMQIQELAYYMEDRMELIVEMEKESHRLRRRLPRRLLNPCMSATMLLLDEKVAEIEQLKGRVEDVSRRNTPSSLIGASRSKTDGVQQQQTARTSTALSMLVEATTTQQRLRGDLTQLLTKRDEDLHVISLWGTCGDFGTISLIRKAYSDPEVCYGFGCRAWVKLTHPFNPQEFIRCLMSQFYANGCEEPSLLGVEVLMKMQTSQDHDLFIEFTRQVSRRYLVILEDLSTMPDWDTIRTFLPDRKNGSRIIVLSQQLEVASLCVGQPHEALELMQLPTKQAVYAFVQESRKDDGDKGGVTNQKYEVDLRGSSYDEILRPENEAANDWMKNSSLVGRKSDMDELVKYLLRARFSSSTPVMSVWGIAGVGKSDLVRSLYYYRMLNDKGSFEKYSWVDVPHPFNLRDFSRSLLKDFHPERDPIQECKQLLVNYRCLIVIDDLQTKEEWDLIQSALVSRPCMSVIIVITTEANTATHCADSPEHVFNVKCLGADAAYDLFKKEVQRKNPLSPLKDLIDVELEELVLKCGGLPRVIVSIATLLAKKTVTLMDTVHSLNKKFMYHLETNPEYDSLRGLFDWMHYYFRTFPDSLKPCIFYLSIFPRGHGIRRRRLVWRWIAEGYSRDSDEESAVDKGENFFSKLLELSIIQQKPQLVTTAFNDSRMASCQVNGFFREYIVSRRMEESLVFELGPNCVLTTQRTGRHLVILKDWDRDKIVFDSIDFSRLRSLTVFGKWESFFISKSMRLLRVIDLEDALGVKDEDVRKIVKWQPRLKFLSLRGCGEIFHLPSSLGDLRQLQTLDVRHTSIVTLPASITKLKKLQYIRAGSIVPISTLHVSSSSSLEFHRCRGLFGVEVPRGIGKLAALHTLGVVNVGVSRGKAIMEELKKLTQLRKLGVSGINKRNNKEFFIATSGLLHLESLLLQFGKDGQRYLDDICLPWENLRSLTLYGLQDKLPQSRNLSKLRKLDLEMDTLEKNDIELLAKLPELCILRVRVKQLEDGKLHFYIGMYGEELATFKQVKILEIGCSSSQLHVEFGSNSMQNLEVLKVDCYTASYQFTGLNFLPELKQVLLKGTNDDIKTNLETQLLAGHPSTPPAVELEK